MNNIRAWATPLTIGAFLLMAVTGILMFFHADSGLNQAAHEWLGWALVVGVAAHAVANWSAVKRYLTVGRQARVIIGAFVLVLLGSFVSLPGEGDEHLPPPVMALKAVTKAPISAVAPLAGLSSAEAIEKLAQAGITAPNAEASLESIVGDDREEQGKAVAALFAKK